MANAPLASLVQHLRRAVAGAVSSDGDGALLERFVRQGDEAAFAALVGRYGPMVLALSRRILHHTHDAEDAFQATFLVLARKAAQVRQRASLGSWLYSVAYRIALQARARIRHPEGPETTAPTEDSLRKEDQIAASQADPAGLAASSELQAIIDEEINRLPEKYRAPVVACYLEGKSNEEAAHLLRWPVGSVKGRLSRAREMLGSRLARRGLGLASPLLGTALTESTVSANLQNSTVGAAVRVAAGQPLTSAGVSAAVAQLTQGALRTMTLHKLTLVSAFLVALAAVAGVEVAFFPKSGPQARGAAEDVPTGGVPLPRGVADPAGKIGYVPHPKGGIAAIDLENGKVLWTNNDVTRPMAVVGNKLAAFASVKDKSTALRIVFLDVGAEGKRLKDSEPISFPDWSVPGQGFDHGEAGKRFAARASVAKGELLIHWDAHASYYGGAAPTPQILQAARKDDAGIARVNLESGKVEMGAAAEQPVEGAKLPAEVEKIVGARGWSVTPVAIIGTKAFGAKMKEDGGIRFGAKNDIVLEAVDIKTGKVLWEATIGEKRFLPPPP